MKNLRHRGAALLAMTAVLVGLSGCSAKRPQTSEVAQCMVEHSSDEELAQLGARTPLGGVSALGRALALACPGGAAFAWDGEYRELISGEFFKAAFKRKTYRAAQYAQLPGVQGTSATERARELAGFLEDVLVTRREVLRCGMADPTSITAVAELDATFVLAALGRYVGINDFNVAKASSAVLIQNVGAGGQLHGPAACDKQLEVRFRGQVQQWARFYEGTHPWAQGCSVKAEPDAFVLKCN